MNDLLGTFTTDFGVGLIDGSVGLVKDIGSSIVNIWRCCYLGAGCDDIVDELKDVVVDGISLGLHVYGNAGWTGSGVGDGGIAFESVGADYAEWLAKSNPAETLVPGEVVGMRAGVISKQFPTADKFMVVSTNPTVVGAMPDSESENEFARVAFMGQVPVRVTGTVHKGDFILPSGHQDGLGMGIRPEDMATADQKWGDEFVCRRCGHGHEVNGRTRHDRHCGSCRFDESATANTLFHKINLLIDDYGLPANSEDLEDGVKVSTWEMGTETSSVGVYYGYGISSATSNQQAKRMTAYSNAEGIVTDLRSSGYEMGNQKEVEAAQSTNTYLGIIYRSGIASLLFLLSL